MPTCADCGRPAVGNPFFRASPDGSKAWCWNAPSFKKWKKGTCLTHYRGEA